eukprot:6211421-Pleurochrysis_carterae.AAC.3
MGDEDEIHRILSIWRGGADDGTLAWAATTRERYTTRPRHGDILRRLETLFDCVACQVAEAHFLQRHALPREEPGSKAPSCGVGLPTVPLQLHLN